MSEKDKIISKFSVSKMAKSFNVFLCVLVSVQLVNCQFGDPCRSTSGDRGNCIRLIQCQPFYQMARTAFSNPLALRLLRQEHCGYDADRHPKVCCPVDFQNNESNLIEVVTPKPTRKVRTTFQPPTLPPLTTTLPPSTTTLRTTTTVPTPTTAVPTPTTTVPTPTTTVPTPTTTVPTPTTTVPTPTTTVPTPTTAVPTPTTTVPTPTTTVPTPTTTVPALNTPKNYSIELFGITCKTVYNTTGSCSDLYLCEPFMVLVRQAKTNPAAVMTLQKAHCGFRNKIPQVCCPLPTPDEPRKKSTTTSTPSAPTRSGDEFLTALPEPPVCGVSNVSLDRVVNGVPAKLGAFPWMAALGYRDESSAAGVAWQCGGALLSSRHVLTAAHCIHRLEDRLFMVRLGELDLARDDDGATPVDILIKDYYKHENYTANNPVLYDVGILLLERDVEFTDLIKPICLFTDAKWRSSTFEDYNPFVAGWGQLKWDGISASHLQVAQLPVTSAEECESIYKKHLAQGRSRDLFPQQALCAGYRTAKIDSCKGDSGGPLMQPLPGNNHRTYIYVIGVVSFGRQCATGTPGAYARVTYYMPWIEEKLLGKARA